MEQELILTQHWRSCEKLLRSYVDLLIEANQRARLTGPQDGAVLWNEHIMDCLPLVDLLPDQGSVIDVGTGGGLPGVVLAICRPELHFTLMDSLSRKCVALSSIVSQMKLPNVTVLCSRSEELAQKEREQWDVAVVRAVSEAPVVAEYLSPLVRVGGKLLAMKGPAWREEVQPIQGKWERIGLSEPDGWWYKLGDKQRWIVQWNKTCPCSPAFPQRPGRAEKVFWWR